MVGNGKGGILMAYVIGSANGKKKANEMKTGESWTNPTDGSTWTKQSDGSVSVKTSAGETFNNAYSPTSSGGSSVGSSKNSQYTGVGTHNDASASAWAKNQINYYSHRKTDGCIFAQKNCPQMRAVMCIYFSREQQRLFH